MHHASFNAMAMLKVFQKLGEVIPMCVHLHGTELKAVSEFGEPARLALEQVLAAASRSLYISTDNKDHLIRLVPNIDRDRLVYFPPWLNEKNFYSVPSGERSMAEFSVVLISRLSGWKRIEALILAAKYFVRETHAHIDLIGEGPHRPELQEIVAEKGMQSHITFHGFMAHHDLGDFLRKRASVVVNTSPVEPFGMTIIEAMACGIPVIATNRGGPADIVSPEIGQLIEDHPDVEVYAERLSNAILKALREDWRTLKGKACVAAAKKFGIHSRHDEIESVLHATIGH
jgi:glycosyltransferase involved in cell wall biosynthesis